MTRKRLFRWTMGVVFIYILAIVTGIVLRIAVPDGVTGPSAAYQTFKDLVPFLIAFPAAWLSYCFQRRASYLKALRELWAILIPAVQQAIQYTHLDNPKIEDFSKAQQDLSTVIDSLRGVFKNIKSNDTVGFYPYENLKVIYKTMDWLKHATNQTADDRYWARRVMLTTWASMHQMLLLEFDREIPVYPLSKTSNDEQTLLDQLKSLDRKPDGQLNNLELEKLMKMEERLQRERLAKLQKGGTSVL